LGGKKYFINQRFEIKERQYGKKKDRGRKREKLKMKTGKLEKGESVSINKREKLYK